MPLRIGVAGLFQVVSSCFAFLRYDLDADSLQAVLVRGEHLEAAGNCGRSGEPCDHLAHLKRLCGRAVRPALSGIWLCS